MIVHARERVKQLASVNVTFRQGDALKQLQSVADYDLVFTSWVLGYIPLRPYFRQTAQALKAGGRLALLVHRQDSPARELSLFRDLVAQHPEALRQDVTFDFPEGSNHLSGLLGEARLSVEQLWEGQVTFNYTSAAEVLEHLLKSGAGTAYDQALDPAFREDLHQQFLALRTQDVQPDGSFRVVHDYVACIARK